MGKCGHTQMPTQPVAGPQSRDGHGGWKSAGPEKWESHPVDNGSHHEFSGKQNFRNTGKNIRGRQNSLKSAKKDRIGEDMEKLELHTLLIGRQSVQLLWKPVWQLLKMLNTESPYDPEIPLLGIYPRKMKTYVHTDLYANVHGNIIHNNQELEQLKCP